MMSIKNMDSVRGEMAIREIKPVIIAMKGHPGTGKSTLANAIASTFKIPLTDKDDIRDSTLSLQRSLPAAVAATLLNDMSYSAMWRIVATQLRLGLSVVVDSPLSRRTHLDRLRELACSAGAQVIVVECKPSDLGTWRQRLEHRGKQEGASWHKPSTWADMEKLIDGYGGCTEYDLGDVPKMVVDTTAPVAIEELVSSVVDFIVSKCSTPPRVRLHESDR